MHPEDIRSAVRKKYGSMAKLSRALNLNDNAVSNAICQPGYSVPLERRIAEAIGLTVQQVWPDRYHADGSPVSLRADRTSTRSADADLRRNGVAA